MEPRRIGPSDLAVAPFCLGGNVFGWTADETTSHAILDRFVAAGFGFIDTADGYSRWAPGHAGGESEGVIGRWLSARPGVRERITLATKVGADMGADMGAGGKGLSAAHIERACEASLRRLRTDRIDLYQSHFDDPATPFHETLGAYDRLIRAGKVRVIGASNLGAPRLREALAVSREAGLPPYACLQPEYSLAERGYEAALEPLCRAEGLGVIGYFALASGFLTGKYRAGADTAGRSRGERVAKYLTPRGLGLLGVLDGAAAELGASPAQVALAWVIARPGITAPIASATSVAQLDELLGAARLVLPPGTIARLDAASADGIAGG